ncbi:MAG: hypothetical protein RI554_01920 [Trueperaceae bacterium]|nr:hypothetical protein [Trueperaceae bacterium]
MVNRQLRRAEEKKERKAEKEKERVKAEKAARRQQRREARKARVARRVAGGPAKGEAAKGGEAKGETPDAPRRRSGAGAPGRFSGILMSATLFFIALQAVAPPSDDGLVADVVSASFYLLYGYFAILWMLRRDAPRARFVVVLGGALMALMTLGVQTFSPDLEIAVRMVALAIPLTLAGAYLGQLVWDKTP